MAVLVKSVATMLATGLCGAHAASGSAMDTTLVQLTMRGRESAEADCHTAVEGDACYQKVAWAMQQGIFRHPDWFPTLSQGSSFNEFQKALSGMERLSGICRAPCETQCRTAIPGDPCYEKVLYAMSEGIGAHPDWYPALTTGSDFHQVQQFLHTLPRLSDTCAEPCAPPAAQLVGADACRTAAPGDECFAAVEYAMKKGFPAHPDWYPSLTASSNFEEFQEYLHSTSRLSHVCAKPCRQPKSEERLPAPPKSEESLPAPPASSAHRGVGSYTQIATNCECGEVLEDYHLGVQGTEQQCGAHCDSMVECQSFGIWSKNATPAHWRGHCRLYAGVCGAADGWETPGACAKPTARKPDLNVYSANVAYNRDS